jgi:hypothetical protein
MTMRRIIHTLFLPALAALLLSGCSSEYENIFSETPDERAEKERVQLTEILKSAPNGWKAQLYTSAGPGYFYYLDFNDNGLVNMVSDFNEQTATEPAEGTWTIKLLQKPTLTFDTYSYIHLPADPDGEVSGGLNGEGLLSDFEFTFSRTAGDSVVLKGLKHNTQMILVKSTPDETTRIIDLGIRNILVNTTDYVGANPGLRIELPHGEILPMAINVTVKMVSAQYVKTNGTGVETYVSPFTFTLQGIHLKTPLVYAGFSISDLTWDADAGVYTVQLDAATALTSSTEPVIFRPSTPLWSVLEWDYPIIYMPEAPYTQSLPGQSAAFVDDYASINQELQVSIYKLTLNDSWFQFNRINKQMTYSARVTQKDNSGSVIGQFTIEYNYAYTISPEGIIDFTPKGANQNGSNVTFEFRTILDVLDTHTFKVEYIAGGFELIGGMYSQNDPGYSFSGYLRKN